MVLYAKGKLIDYVGIDSKTGRYLAVDPQTLQPVPAPLAIPLDTKIGPIIVVTFQMIIQRSHNRIQPVTFRMKFLSVGDVSPRRYARASFATGIWSATGRYTTP